MLEAPSERTPASGWPAVAYEEQSWVPSEDAGGSRAQVRRHRGPYRSAVPPLLGERPVLLATHLAAAAEDAATEVARFDAELGDEIVAFTPVLLRTESTASSRIENVTASARAIAEAELGGRPGGDAAEVVGNVAAMTAATALADDLGLAALMSMHEVLMHVSDPDSAGVLRTQQVWIGGSSLGPHSALFVPPHHDRVPALLTDLVEFMARDDVPVLAHTALAHAQFETVHPFTDGNGRTGRALVHAMLRSKGLTRNVTVPLSAGLLVDIDGYFDALTAYRAGDVEPIVTRFVEAAFAATANGRRLVQDLREVRDSWVDRIPSRRGSTARQLADVLLRRPVVDVAAVTTELGIARQNVHRAVDPLLDAGVLTASGSPRHRLWRADEVLAAVDAFAARAGRRPSA